MAIVRIEAGVVNSMVRVEHPLTVIKFKVKNRTHKNSGCGTLVTEVGAEMGAACCAPTKRLGRNGSSGSLGNGGAWRLGAYTVPAYRAAAYRFLYAAEKDYVH